MRATEFEFRYRFWLILLMYFAGFGCYAFDHRNVSEAVLMWVANRSGIYPNALGVIHAIQALFTVSALLIATAAWIRTWGGAYLRTEVVHDVNTRTEKLVVDGPYRHLRNPLYLGNIFLAAGFAMLASRTGSVIVLLGNLLIVLRLIGWEEAAMAQSQGEAYDAYRGAVPRLWPSLRPRLPAGGMEPRWLQAFLGESHLWIFAVAGFLYARKLNLHFYYTILWIGLAARILVWNVLDRARRRSSPTPAPGRPIPPTP